MYQGNNAIKLKLCQLFKNRKTYGDPNLQVWSVTMDRGVVLRNTLDKKMAPDISPNKCLLIEPGDIVYNMMRMWQGAVAVCKKRGVVSPAYVVCKPGNNIDSVFAYYFFKSKPILHRLKSYSFGITGDRLRLYYKDFASILVSLPPFPEQKKIAEILSSWEEAIEQTRNLIEAKRRRKKALMQQLLTGKRRLAGFNNKWKEFALGKLFNERVEPNNHHLPLLAITGNRGIIPAEEIDRRDSSSADKSRYKKIMPGDIGYNTMRMGQGVSAVSKLEGIVSPAYTVCIPKDDVDADFMGYLFKYPPIIHLFWRHSQGLVSDTLNLKFPHFAKVKVRIPSIVEQRSIVNVLSDSDREILIHEKKLSALEKQKRGLMQKLLTGEIRVKI
jgi:type I restriction enzyme S subunit